MMFVFLILWVFLKNCKIQDSLRDRIQILHQFVLKNCFLNGTFFPILNSWCKIWTWSLKLKVC